MTKPIASTAQSEAKQKERLRIMESLFTGEIQYENFNRMPDVVETKHIDASTSPKELPVGPEITLPTSFTFDGVEVNTEAFLKETDTTSFIVLKDGKIRLERYMLTGGQDVKWWVFSVGKSVVSALIGIAVSEGHIGSIEEPVTKYVPQLVGSGYEGVRIKDILQMSSGVRWNEDYSDPNSDIKRAGAILAQGGSMDEFVATFDREREPGTYNQYKSVDTQVLGMLLTKATGRTIADYMQEKLWNPIGAEQDAYQMTDSLGVEKAFGGLIATARDFLKVGELFRNKGNWNGQQIIPESWIDESVTPDAPHVQTGENEFSEDAFGYGYQWWIPEGDEGEYSAIGVYNQFIYVNPTHDLVIVKLSTNRHYATELDPDDLSEVRSIELFRAIGKMLSQE